MNDLVKQTDNQVVVTQNSINQADRLIELALSKDADIEKLTKLMELKEKYEKQEAEKAFVSAMAEFKKDPPKITKNKRVNYSTSKGKTDYMHASLDHICEAVDPRLGQLGFSYSWETNQNEAYINVKCVLTHCMGHSKTVDLNGSPDQSGGKNSVQAIGSTVSYLQRYTLLASLGLATSDQDDDGGRPKITVDDLLRYNETVREWIFNITATKQGILDQDYATAKEAIYEIPKEVRDYLWKAPSKGGIFTTQERDVMKTSEWREA